MRVQSGLSEGCRRAGGPCPEMTHTVEIRDGLAIEQIFAGDPSVFMALEVTTELSLGCLRCQAAITEEAV